jgi:hypothetical protein
MFHSFNEETDAPKRSYKPRRKKRLKGLPNKVVVLKNIDKDVGNWVENWDTPKKRSPGCIIHPFRLLALGNVSRGKTNSLKNIFLKHQSSAKKFQHLYVITCSLDSQEWLDCEPDAILDRIPPLDLFDGAEKTMVVLDDYEFKSSDKEQSKRLATLCRFVSSHRNVSVMISYQSFFDCPPIARKCANCFLLYKPNSRQEIETIANRVGLDKGLLRSLFKHECNGNFDSVFVDLTVNTPYPLRKNIYEPLELVGSDSDSG